MPANRCGRGTGPSYGGQPASRQAQRVDAPGSPRSAACGPRRPARPAPSTATPNRAARAGSAGSSAATAARSRAVDGRPGVALAEHRAGDHPAHVRVDHRVRAGRRRSEATARAVYAPTPGSASSSSTLGRHHAAVPVHDRLRGLVQPQRPARVAELAPHPDRLAGRRRRAGRPARASAPATPVRGQHPGHRRLLQHDLADQHRPGETPGRRHGRSRAAAGVPVQDRVGEPAHPGRVGHGLPDAPWRQRDRRGSPAIRIIAATVVSGCCTRWAHCRRRSTGGAERWRSPRWSDCCCCSGRSLPGGGDGGGDRAAAVGSPSPSVPATGSAAADASVRPGRADRVAGDHRPRRAADADGSAAGGSGTARRRRAASRPRSPPRRRSRAPTRAAAGGPRPSRRTWSAGKPMLRAAGRATSAGAVRPRPRRGLQEAAALPGEPPAVGQQRLLPGGEQRPRHAAAGGAVHVPGHLVRSASRAQVRRHPRSASAPGT